MKKFVSCVITLIMVFSLAAVPAYAANSITVNAGESINYPVTYNYEDEIDAVYFDGNEPDGVFVQVAGDLKFTLTGAIDEPGTYNFRVDIDWVSGQHSYEDFSITVRTPSVTAPSSNLGGAVGTAYSVEYQLESGGELMNGSYQGTVPPGLTITFYDSYFTITGTPTTAGTYDFTVLFYDDAAGTNVRQPVVFVVAGDDPSPSPSPSPSPAPKAELKVTKSPTSESVTEGGSAVFIAHCDNAAKIVWRIVSPDTKTTLSDGEAESYFKGMYMDGIGTDTLTLYNIPLAMNNWKVQAKYIDADKNSVLTDSAGIYVSEAMLNPPTISTQPKGGDLSAEPGLTLTVKATAQAGSTVTYQWYRNEKNSASGGSPIAGATSANYTPEKLEGTYYYYCAVRSSGGNKVSTAAYTTPVAVNYTAPAPAATPEPTPEQPAETETPAETQPPVTVVDKPGNSGGTAINHRGNAIFYVLASISAIALLGIIGTVIYIIIEKKRHPEDF